MAVFSMPHVKWDRNWPLRGPREKPGKLDICMSSPHRNWNFS
jgi:hypothetical protein